MKLVPGEGEAPERRPTILVPHHSVAPIALVMQVLERIQTVGPGAMFIGCVIEPNRDTGTYVYSPVNSPMPKEIGLLALYEMKDNLMSPDEPGNDPDSA